MQRFEDLHIDEQNRLLIAVLEGLAASGTRTIEQAAQASDMTIEEFWSEICADTGLDECRPWSGYPQRPDDFPPARGGDRKLTDEQQKIVAQLSEPTKN